MERADGGERVEPVRGQREPRAGSGVGRLTGLDEDGVEPRLPQGQRRGGPRHPAAGFSDAEIRQATEFLHAARELTDRHRQRVVADRE